MVARSRALLAAAAVALVLRVVAGCSKSPAAAPPPAPEAGPGEAFTACEIQGYVSELEGGLCPEGTCPALAFDTNGARVPCCTSIASGPAMCVDGAGGGPPDGAEEAPAEGGDATLPVEAGPEGGAEAATDGMAMADADGGGPEDGASPDAADGE